MESVKGVSQAAVAREADFITRLFDSRMLSKEDALTAGADLMQRFRGEGANPLDARFDQGATTEPVGSPESHLDRMQRLRESQIGQAAQAYDEVTLGAVKTLGRSIAYLASGRASATRCESARRRSATRTRTQPGSSYVPSAGASRGSRRTGAANHRGISTTIRA